MEPLIKQINKVHNHKAVLIRHGQTMFNKEDLARGWSEVPLDEKGERDAKNLGKKLKDANVYGIIASDLLRTIETARAISCETGWPILELSPYLHTWNIGKYTEMPTEVVDPILEKMAVEKPREEIEGGESFDYFKNRWLMSLVAYMNKYEGKTLAFVTHGRNLACLHAWREAGYDEDLELDHDELGYDLFKPASAHLFDIDSNYLK